MILDKAKMAHDWAIKYGKVDSNHNRENTVQLAWDYADAMQAESDKRKPKGLPDAIKGLESSKKIPPLDKDATIKYSDGLVIDWSQAPESVKFWAMDENGSAAWYEVMPYIDVDEFNYEFGLGGATHVKAPSFNYQGNWQDSLRKRP